MLSSVVERILNFLLGQAFRIKGNLQHPEVSYHNFRTNKVTFLHGDCVLSKDLKEAWFCKVFLFINTDFSLDKQEKGHKAYAFSKR